MDNFFTFQEPVTSKVQKRCAGTVDVSVLNEGQKQGFDTIVNFLQSENKFFILSGAAGTGKTFLVSHVIEDYLDKFPANKICLTAPTNKAVRVLKNSFSFEHSNLSFRTIHSLMGLRMVRKGDKEVFEQKQAPEINFFNLVIIDEASMLDSVLLSMIMAETRNKVLFIGDEAQLPPVEGNNSDSPIFKMPFDCYRLTQIVRQAKGNPIIELCSKAREHVFTGLDETNKTYLKNNYVCGVFQHNKENKKEVATLLRKYFSSINFDRNGDFAKVLCFTNAKVNSYNEYLRKVYFGKSEIGKIEIGEKLVVKGTVKAPDDPDKILFSINDELEVCTIFDEILKLGDKEIKYLACMVKDVNSGEQGELNIVSEQSEQDLKNILEKISNAAKAAEKGSDLKKQLWQKFYQLKDFFHQVGYNYAMTVHRAQGSTFNNVIFDLSDSDIIFDSVQKRKLQYTAFSRASERLHLII